MKQKERIVASLFVALAVGLGWGIRGNFGHQLGAMVPGAALALAFAYVSGQTSLFRLMPILGGVAALTISLGGGMSYGILHGYAKSDTFINYAYGFFTLVLQGGTWGGFGGGALGLLMEDERPKVKDWLSLALCMTLAGAAVYFVIVRLAGFHINPPRSDLSIAYFGSMAAMFAWLKWKQRNYALRGAVFAFLGFGLGMAFARLLSNMGHYMLMNYDQWKIMEIGTGFFGGFVFTYAMLGKEVKTWSESRLFTIASYLGIFLVMAVVPILHRLWRVTPESLGNEVAGLLRNATDANPAAFTQSLMTALYVVLGLAVFAAVAWSVIHKKNLASGSAFPVLALMGVMLLVDNIKSLFPFTPPDQGSFRVEATFWIFYILMLALLPIINRSATTVPAQAVKRDLALKKVLLWSLLIYIFILIVAGIVNGPKTMSSANTRWPVWSWTNGPATKK
jgi:hypothetical protein